MQYKELLADFITNMLTNNDDAARQAFSRACGLKAKTLNTEAKVFDLKESFNEAVYNLLGDHADKYELGENNTIIINGKVVGKLVVNVNDFHGGFNFVDANGTYSKEFDDINDLANFLSARYGKHNVK